MKNSLPGNDIAVADRREAARKSRLPRRVHCSICTSTIWFHPIALKEPVGAPEPRQTWVLCNSCHEHLLAEMRRSPVRSPLRLRIAIGIVASERSPEAYGTSTHVRDQRRFIGIAWVLIVAMLLHLAVIVILAAVAR